MQPNKLDTLLACLPASPFKDQFTAEINALRQACAVMHVAERKAKEISDARQAANPVDTADAVRLRLAETYARHLERGASLMCGNIDWARLEGAVEVVRALKVVFTDQPVSSPSDWDEVGGQAGWVVAAEASDLRARVQELEATLAANAKADVYLENRLAEKTARVMELEALLADHAQPGIAA